MEQCGLVRTAMRAEVLQNGLRKKAIDVLRLCAVLDFEGAYAMALEYRAMVEREIEGARAAIAAVESVLKRAPAQNAIAMSRQQAARAMCVTPETLRTWERNGLLTVGRAANGYRVYTSGDMERLGIIRTLRCANYSISAILRLLKGLDENAGTSVEALLNTPHSRESIISVCDRLIASLTNTRNDAAEMAQRLAAMKANHLTIQ